MNLLTLVLALPLIAFFVALADPDGSIPDSLARFHADGAGCRIRCGWKNNSCAVLRCEGLRRCSTEGWGRQSCARGGGILSG